MSASVRRPTAVVPRLLAVLLAGAWLLVAAQTPAAAHAELVATAPAADSSAGTAPDEVTLTFSEPLRGADVTVTGPDGARASAGPVAVTGAEVRVPVVLAVSGRYDVVWYATADDGHPLQGSFGFDSAPTAPDATGATGSPDAGGPGAPAEATDDAAAPVDEGAPGWVLPVVAGAALVGGGLVLRRRRR